MQGVWGVVCWLRHISPPSPADPTNLRMMAGHSSDYSLPRSLCLEEHGGSNPQPSSYQHFMAILGDGLIDLVIFNFILFLVLFSFNVGKNGKGSLVRTKIFEIFSDFPRWNKSCSEWLFCNCCQSPGKISSQPLYFNKKAKDSILEKYSTFSTPLKRK